MGLAAERSDWVSHATYDPGKPPPPHHWTRVALQIRSFSAEHGSAVPTCQIMNRDAQQVPEAPGHGLRLAARQPDFNRLATVVRRAMCFILRS
jgi:hypothetical protein